MTITRLVKGARITELDLQVPSLISYLYLFLGIHRFTSLINKKTVTVTVIALVIILIGGLCLFIWNESKEGYKYEPETVEGTTPLMVKWKLLGEFKDNR